MFYSCEDMSCSAKKFKEISDRGSNSYSIYTELMIRHWDHWYTEGSASHVFYQKIKNVDNMPVLDGNPVDMINKQNLCSPPIEYGSEQFDISSNEKYIAFSVHRKDRNMSWTTKWDILLYDVDNKNYINVTTEVLGRAQNPKFSPDSTKLAYFYMKRSGLESDILRMQIFDISQQKTIPPKFLNEPKQFPQDFIWSDEKNNLLIYTTLEAGRHILYEYSYNDDTYKQLTSSTDNNSYGIPKKIDVNKYFIDYSSHKFPTVFGILEKKTESDFYESTIFFDPNKEDLLNYEMIDPEYFTYKGVNDDEIQGWLLKPINFDEKKKYPLAFLIHGGPEGSWDTSWSYRWNPQLFANRGYAVVTINPHGSSGMGIEFQDAVRNDWGGAPFKDLMLGWNYVKEKYKWIDMDRVGGCGASYGGYMVNWIQGNNDDKKFKCLVTHDGVFSTVTMFYATEEMWFPMSEYCPHDKWGCTPFNSENEREGYEKFSPESRVDKWNTPHLIIHGSKDYRIPITEGISAFTALQIRNVESRFLHFPDENHWVLKPENSIKWYDEVLGWLDKFLDNN
jgi:dipeptidyl aminopeptidase/acylaminoacyl peptidase